jgi:hypothetical protein
MKGLVHYNNKDFQRYLRKLIREDLIRREVFRPSDFEEAFGDIKNQEKKE